MDELELEIALDRLITEFIVNVSARATARQTRIDSFLSVQALTLDEAEIAALLTETGAIRVEIEAMINDAVREYKNMIVEAAQTGRSDVQRREGADRLWRWRAEPKACPDCANRDGEVHTYEYWESVGPPQSGTTICGASCRCVLVDTEGE